MKVIVYFKLLNSIGGVESWLYYLSKKYDFTFYYKEGDAKQIQRLSRNIEVKKYNGGILKCDTFIVNYNPDIIDNVEANEYIEVIHTNYKNIEYKPILHPKITKYIGVSQEVCNTFTELTGKPCELIYNPTLPDKPQKVLRLISATRLSKEKGRDRMERLGNILENMGIEYIWYIFTDNRNEIPNPRIIYQSPRLDISGFIQDADFLVQLSDTEAYCYSVVESLILGVPVIVTDLPVYKELGLNGENSIILPLDFSSIEKDKLYKKYDFKFKVPKSAWDKYLPTEKTYDPNEEVLVEATRNYTDLEKGEYITKGKQYKVSQYRKSYLECIGYIKEVI